LTTALTTAHMALRFGRLPLSFDVAALMADLARLAGADWMTHFNTGYHDGGWSGLALVSDNGDASRLYGDPLAAGPGCPTPHLSACPAMAAVLDALPAPVQSARLLRLAPGSVIREHRDHGLGLDEGLVRLHVPIVAGPAVEFVVDGVRVPMSAGECWYLDLSLPHRVSNPGPGERIHLVLDVRVVPALRALLPDAAASEVEVRTRQEAAPETGTARVERFCAVALEDTALLDTLKALPDAASFAAAVVAAGAERGMHFSGEDVHAVLRERRRAWVERQLPGAAPPQAQAPATNSKASTLGSPDARPSLDGWLPVAAQCVEGRLYVDLCRLGAQRFIDPFFEQTVSTCLREPFHLLLRRRLDADALAATLTAQKQPAARPLDIAGFVFHVSRCGSTLLGRLLATSPAHRVLSEPPPLDAALCGGGSSVGDATRIAWLRTLIAAFARSGHPAEQRLFVKFDSWHSSLLPLVMRAFPDVPWVFLMRDPVEVIVSHLKQPGAQMVPGMVGFTPPGVAAADAWRLPRAEYVARMVGAFEEGVEASLREAGARAKVVDYATLPSDAEHVIWPHFGLHPTAEERAAMESAWARDAKNPTATFSPDAQAKQEAADPSVREAAARWAVPAWQRLRQRVG
jgi:hypothetical protein